MELRKDLFTRALSAALALTMLALCGCGAQDKAAAAAEAAMAAQNAAIPVEITAPTRADLRRDTEFVGRIEAGSAVNVYAEISAQVLETYFNVGESVNAGDLLMVVDDTAMQTAVANAETSVKTAKLTYEQTRQKLAISTEGSGYIATQMGNQKQLSDLLDSYYDALRSKGKLNGTLDEVTYKLWEATSAKEKAQSDFTSYTSSDGALVSACAGIYRTGQTAFDANNITVTDIRQYIEGTSNAAVSVRIATVLESNQPLTQTVANVQYQYNARKSAVTAAATAEATAQAALTTAEKTYDSSATTIDTSIRTVTKNYNYYAGLIGLQDTLGASETAALNELTLALTSLSVESAERGLQTAKDNLEKCKLYAPVSGVILTKNAVKSNYAAPSVAAYVIDSDEATPVISFNISEAGASAIATGSRVTVCIGAEEYNAIVTEVANATTANTGLYAAKAAITDAADISRTGGVVKVRLATAEAPNALTLPLTMIEYDGDQPYIYVFDNGSARRRDLTLGMDTGKTVEIVSGLTEADKVIATWHPDLKDGAAVSLMSEPASTSIEIVE